MNCNASLFITRSLIMVITIIHSERGDRWLNQRNHEKSGSLLTESSRMVSSNSFQVWPGWRVFLKCRNEMMMFYI